MFLLKNTAGSIKIIPKVCMYKIYFWWCAENLNFGNRHRFWNLRTKMLGIDPNFPIQHTNI